MQGLSPELVLVDPELAKIARLLLRDPWDPPALGISRRGRPTPPPTARIATQPTLSRKVPIAQSKAPRTSPQRRRSLGRLPMAVGAVVLLGAIAVPQLANRPVKPTVQAVPQKPTAQDANEPATASAPAELVRLPQQVGGAVAKPSTRTVEITWPAERSADVYNVILLRNGMRIDLWSTRATLDLTAGPSRSARRVSPGTYKWFVYPGAQRDGKVAYGELIAHGVVRARAS